MARDMDTVGRRWLGCRSQPNRPGHNPARRLLHGGNIEPVEGGERGREGGGNERLRGLRPRGKEPGVTIVRRGWRRLWGEGLIGEWGQASFVGHSHA